MIPVYDYFGESVNSTRKTFLTLIMYELLFGLILALSDALNMSLMKSISQGAVKFAWMIVPTVLYMTQPWIFQYGLLSGVSMTVLNLSWDLFSDVLVTLVGLFVFGESMSPIKKYGVGFALLALGLFAADGYNGAN